MSSNRFHRRSLLRSAGLLTLCAPFLSLFEQRSAQAQVDKSYRNLLLFFTNGTDIPSWTPKGSTENKIVWSKMTEPLDAVKQNLILVEKLSSFGSASSHGSPGGLTGLGYGPPTHISIEQYVSDRLPQTPIKNVLLGGVPTEQQTTFYRSGRALSPVDAPDTAWKALFSGFTPGGGGSAPTPSPAADDTLRRRKSVLDLVSSELAALSSTLGASERQKLELHAESIRQLELTLQGAGSSGGETGGAECSVPDQPAKTSEPLLNSALHLDLAIQAFACGRTRVAAVQFGHHQNTQVSLPEVGTPGDWHNTFMHSDMAPRTRLINLERWLCGQFVRAVQKLASIPLADGSGSLLDETLVVWARDMGDGVLHSGDDMRFVFAGGAGKYLSFSPDGRYLDGKGEHHQTALIAIAEALGVTDLASFGDPGYPRKALDGLAT